jgi:hypothetical protein
LGEGAECGDFKCLPDALDYRTAGKRKEDRKLHVKAITYGYGRCIGKMKPVSIARLNAAKPTFAQEPVTNAREDMWIEALWSWPRIADLLFKGAHVSDPISAKNAQYAPLSNFLIFPAGFFQG